MSAKEVVLQGAWVFACVVPGVTVTVSGTGVPDEEVVVVQIGRDVKDPRNKLYKLLNRRLQVQGFDPDDCLDETEMEDVEERLGGVVETIPRLPKVSSDLAFCYVCPPHVKPADPLERSQLEGAHLAMTTRNLESARDGMKEVNQHALFEVASYNKPSPMVLRVMQAVLTLIGEANVTRSWEDIRNFMRKDEFLPSIRDFDGENVSEETKKSVRTMIANPQFTHKAAKHASKALGPLQQWVCAMMNYIDTHFAPPDSPRKLNLALQSPRNVVAKEESIEITVDKSLRDRLEANRFSKVETSIGWCKRFGVTPVESCGFELVFMTRSDFDNRLHAQMVDHDLPKVFDYDSFQGIVRGMEGFTRLDIDRRAIFHVEFKREACVQFFYTDSQHHRFEDEGLDVDSLTFDECMQKLEERVLFLNLSNNPIFPHSTTKRKRDEALSLQFDVFFGRFAWKWANEADKAEAMCDSSNFAPKSAIKLDQNGESSSSPTTTSSPLIQESTLIPDPEAEVSSGKKAPDFVSKGAKSKKGKKKR